MSVDRFGSDGILLGGQRLLVADGYEVYDDATVSGLAAAGPTATQAQIETYRGKIKLRHWDTGEEAGGNWHFTHRWKPQSTAYPHMHVKLRTGTIATTAKAKFELAYILGKHGAVDSDVAILGAEFDLSNLEQYTELYLVFPSIDMTGYYESANVSFNLERLTATSDEYADKLAVAEIDCHILIQKQGTLTQTPGSGP